MKLKTGTSSIKGTDRADKLAARRERDRARRHAKRTAEVWAMPADEVPTEERGSCSILDHMRRGPCSHIAAAMDGLLCGLIGKIVARLEENCTWLLGDKFDRSGAGCGLV